jgi:hypothetical protein
MPEGLPFLTAPPVKGREPSFSVLFRPLDYPPRETEGNRCLLSGTALLSAPWRRNRCLPKFRSAVPPPRIGYKAWGDTHVQVEALLSLSLSVAAEQSVQGVLDRIVRGLAAQPGVALAGIWLLMPGDLCDTCFLRAECCDQTQCLHLAASSGAPLNSFEEDWSFLQGYFRRVPLNERKVGVIGATGNPILIEDLAPENDWIARPEWAKRDSKARSNH